MTRRRARRNKTSRKETGFNLNPQTKSAVLVVKSYSNALLNNAGGHLYAGEKNALHPANGVVTSTPITQLLSDNLLGPNLTLVAGVFTKGTIRRVKTEINFLNLEAFPVKVKVGYLNSNSYTNFTNNSQIQDVSLLADGIVYLEKTGVVGDMKSITLEWNIPVLEGNFDPDAYKQNTIYWITYASSSTAGIGWYVQYNDQHLTNNLVSGVSIDCVQTFTIDILQQNKMLLV